jgi:hypothetical protein
MFIKKKKEKERKKLLEEQHNTTLAFRTLVVIVFQVGFYKMEKYPGFSSIYQIETVLYESAAPSALYIQNTRIQYQNLIFNN